jgi:NADPH-dependent 2,4-dienoyl-CoA reductase/sulfur reductase-like enzyme/rhodanese-related sulfurtransferase
MEDAEIIVLDRGSEVSFANCGLPYYVGGEISDEAELSVQTPESLKASLNLDVRTRHDVVALDANAKEVTVMTDAGTTTIGYDALVLSPGAQAIRPPLPGIDSPRVHTLRSVPDAIRMREFVDQGATHAVVLGGGFIGIEAAEALAQQGLDVQVVELAPHVLPPLETELASLVTHELQRLGITIHEGIGADSIVHAPERDTVVLADGTSLPADLIVLSVGVRPDTEVWERAGVECERGAIVIDEHGRTSLPGVWAVGDAVVSTDAVTGARRPVALAGPANRAGRLVADHIANPATARPIPHPLGTAIVRVGSLTAATTGANRQSLDQHHIPYRTLHLHPLHHAGYFPGASAIHLVVHVHEVTGAILGAQAVGADGVDKRIDVIATAMRGDLVVDDLIDIDLSYSPPYGQAKDAVNLLGMEGANLRDGTIQLWYAEDLAQAVVSGLILDVRRAREFASGHVPGALHIPHTELRGRIAEVRDAAQGRPVYVMCASGVRSYIAHRVLVSAGIDSSTLSGGIHTLRAALGERADAELTTAVAT